MTSSTCRICEKVAEEYFALPCCCQFCISCIKIHYYGYQPGESVRCPQCQHPFEIPPQGITGLSHYRSQTSTETPNLSSGTPSTREVNILLMGESGCGKSTWVDGFANYIQFASLKEAENAEGSFPVPVRFTITDQTTFKSTIISIGNDDNENYMSEASSVTQSPTMYTFSHNDGRINLIDTPGIGDTRGKSQDRVNVESILKFISSFGYINVICILIKSSQSRLTPAFEYCLTEIMRRLHASASRNVVFCLTNARTSDYTVGDTIGPLSAFLAKSEGLSAITLNPQNCYCVENEPVRYLAYLKKRIPCNRALAKSAAVSWQHSSEQMKKLLAYAFTLPPHAVSDTLSLNSAKHCIDAVTQPLIESIKLIAPNLAELEKKLTEITKSNSVARQLDDMTEITQLKLKMKPLHKSATVCTASEHIHVVNGITVYDNVCDPCCKWAPTLYWCTAMKHGQCMQCGCSYTQHKWVTCLSQVVEERLTVNYRGIKQRIEESRNERKQLTKICAQLSMFLQANSLCGIDSGKDSITECFHQEIEMLKATAAKSSYDQITACVLEEFIRVKEEYAEQQKAAQGQVISSADVFKLIEALYKLPLSGEQLSEATNVVHQGNDKAVKVRRRFFHLKQAFMNFVSTIQRSS